MSAYPALLSREDAANALSVSLRSIDTLIASGDLPVVRLGRAVRIKPAAIDYLVDSRESRINPRQKRKRA